MVLLEHYLEIDKYMIKFFRNVWKSIYNPSFYKELETRSTWLSVRYYFGLICVIAFFLGLGATAVLGPMLSTFLGQAKPVVLDIYPKELVVTIKAGTAASNVTEPYFVKMPDKMKQFFGATTTNINLVVINTRENADQGKFQTMNSLVLVAKDGLMIAKNGEGKTGTEFQPYTNDIVMTHDVYAVFVDKLAGFGNKLPVVMLVVFFIGFFIWGIIRMAYFLLAAVLVYLLLKARKMPATYGHAYRLTLHAATLPILLNFFLSFIMFDPRALAVLPFLFTIILLAVVWFNTQETKSA